jgi:alpha-D-ribose 1-methylphosphonate 5-triphosphate synthase subunit PhnG
MDKANLPRPEEREAGEAATARADWLGVLSRARPNDIEALAAGEVAGLAFDWLRRPHVGLVMVRGRAGGTGTVFNLGEMTITRCSVQLEDGTVGHGYAQGRSRRQAELVALLDALLQKDDGGLIERVIRPLRASEIARRNERSRKAAATKVEFFAMVRGANPA